MRSRRTRRCTLAALGVSGSLLCARGLHAQSPRITTFVATIEPVYADSAGHATWRGRLVTRGALTGALTRLRSAPGATVWFSWAGAPGRRTPAQDAVLALVRRIGPRVDLRTDSTIHARPIWPDLGVSARPPHEVLPLPGTRGDATAALGSASSRLRGVARARHVS